MNATRQDAWSDDEDTMLAETVLRHIREGKTQLEAFKEVAKQLSRTPAACGFRWNAAIRKQYQDAIYTAKEERKQGSGNTHLPQVNDFSINQEKSTIETAISLLEKMKINCADASSNVQAQQERLLNQLEQENERLQAKLSRYDAAWKEMGNLWNWVQERNNE